jgi:hypothetical protein
MINVDSRNQAHIAKTAMIPVPVTRPTNIIALTRGLLLNTGFENSSGIISIKVECSRMPINVKLHNNRIGIV